MLTVGDQNVAMSPGRQGNGGEDHMRVRTLSGVVWAGGMVILPRRCHCCRPTGKGFISLHLLCNHGHLKFGQKLIDVL